MQRHSDDLFRFSYRVFTIEFIIFKIAFLGFSLYGLYKFAEHEIRLNQEKPQITNHAPDRGIDKSPPQ